MADVLVVNAGSTSLKLTRVDESEASTPVESLAAAGNSVRAVAHRIVHGGARFRAPVVIDATVRAAIEALEPLAPLHNAPALRALADAQRVLPDLPHIAVFDTAFHATISDEAAVYAVPRRWRDEWGVRRYGFHGLSVAWCAERVPALLGRQSRGLRMVVCHLGGGSSVTALVDGRSVDTSMGFSPLEGVPMATRSGSVDPGALLFVLREHGLTPEMLDRVLNTESGLWALAGTDDVAAIEQSARRGKADAVLALGVLCHRLTGAVAAMAAAAGGLDALVFTAGIGEGSAVVRQSVCERLGFLGVTIDPTRNGTAKPDCDVASLGAAISIMVIHAREDVIAARAARSLVAAAASGAHPLGRRHPEAE